MAANKRSATIVILYDGKGGGSIQQLANCVANGVLKVPDAQPRLCPISKTDISVLHQADALIIGCPNWSGMTATLKEWFDKTGHLWEEGVLAGKPGGAFTASWSHSAGTEATLLQLLHLLFANGLYAVGLPWNDTMRESGSYYGATAHGTLTQQDRTQAELLGKRIAELAILIKNK